MLTPTSSFSSSKRARYLAVGLVFFVANAYPLCCLFSALILPNPIKYLTRAQLEADAGKFNDSNKIAPERLAVRPCIIHQTYKDDLIPPWWDSVRDTITRRNAECTIYFWTDETILEFMEKEYPWFLPSFDSYYFTIQRVDAFRYFALYHFGGVYVDLDIGVSRSFNYLLQFDAVLPKTQPFGFSNDVLIAWKGHPFYKRLIDSLVLWNRWIILPYLTVLLGSGPLFVTIQYHLASRQEIEGIIVMDEDVYGSGGPFFFHFGGSSWHQLDIIIVRFFIELFKYYSSPDFVVYHVLIAFSICLFIFMRLTGITTRRILPYPVRRAVRRVRKVIF